jgi:hypothetical protein
MPVWTEEGERMTSPKKMAANRANAAKSTGPKTPSGKCHSKINAVKFGFYASELLISDRDREAFDALQVDLATQLAPRSALQRIACEQIIACVWRVKQALRMEAACLAGRLGTEKESEVGSAGREFSPPEWYGTTDGNVRRAIRFLGDLREHVSQNGLRRVAEDPAWKDPIVGFFGPEFFELLVPFKDLNIDAIQLTRHLVEQSRIFDWPLPTFNVAESPTDQSASAERAQKEPPSMPPELQLNMVIAIIDLQSQHLKDALRTRSVGDVAQVVIRQEFPRYFSEASRDLQRALDSYIKLKKKRL